MAEFKARMHLLPTLSDPRICGTSEGPKAWLLRRQSRALLSSLLRSSPTWVPAACGGSRRAERRLRQRLVQARRRLESLQALLTPYARKDRSDAGFLGPKAQRPLQGFLETEVLELNQLVRTLQCDLDCLLQQLMGELPCANPRCVAVSHALWTGRLPSPWRPYVPAGAQPPWQWLRQLSRRGQLLVRYLSVDEGTQVPERIFHLSAFRHPRRLLLALRWEAVLASSNVPGSQGSSSNHPPHKIQELTNNPLHLRVSWCCLFCSPFHPSKVPDCIPISPFDDLAPQPPQLTCLISLHQNTPSSPPARPIFPA